MKRLSVIALLSLSSFLSGCISLEGPPTYSQPQPIPQLPFDEEMLMDEILMQQAQYEQELREREEAEQEMEEILLQEALDAQLDYENSIY